MDSQAPRCAITGSNGYLGSRLSARLGQEGWHIYSLQRMKGRPENEERTIVSFSMRDGPPKFFFRDEQIDVLIHCAYDFSLHKWSEIEEANVQGSVRLMRAARAEGVRKIILISTMSAFAGCQSLYGKAKLLIEDEALRMGGTVIRPGLIYGEAPGGMVGSLAQTIKKSSYLPLIGSGKQILYLTHEDDLATLVKTIVKHDLQVEAPIVAAAEQGLSFRSILHRLAQMQQKKITLIPLPWQLVWGVLKITESCGFSFRLRSDSVISLVNQNPHPDFTQTRKTKTTFRNFA